MSKNDIEPAGAQPVWPIVPHGGGALALPQGWAPQPSAGGLLPGDLNLATLWRIVSEWRWLILGAVAVGVAGAIVITFLTTPLYRSQVMLEINPPTVEPIDESKIVKQQWISDRSYLATVVGLLKSRSLAERVAQDLNLTSNPAFAPTQAAPDKRLQAATGRLMQGLNAEPVVESRLVKVSFTSSSPSIASQVANSFAENFISSAVERRFAASAYARRFLERELAKHKTDLENSERQLVDYAQQQGIINTGGGGSGGGDSSKGGGGGGSDTDSLQGQSLVALNGALADAQQRRMIAEQNYRNSMKAVNTADVNSSTQALRQQRATLEADYQSKLATFKPDYPDMVRLRTSIQALDQQIQREAGTVASGQSNTLLIQYRAAAATEREIQGKVDALKSQVLNLRARSIQYNILQREVETARTQYENLLSRYKDVEVAGGLDSSAVSIVDKAEPPSLPFKPNLILNLLMGLGLGLVAGIGAALALEFLNDTIKTPDDVRDKLHLPSLGVIPMKRGNEALAEELKDQSSAVSEAYFSLRTSLQFTTDTGAPKSLLITSTRAAEGKSSTTLALAQNFARLGNRVLLVDGDLRKPAFVTGLEPNEGLSKLLTNHEPLDEHILDTQYENLSLLPCGPLPPNPAELLASPRLKAILADALTKYDMVIVDGPPVLGLADAPLLSGVCRATLLVVESGRTRTKAALDAITRLRAAGGNIVGAALTKFRARAHGYGYGYGYGYEPYRYGGVTSREREIKLLAQRES
ncbi:MAG TPA: polysaccharide biosynthesis tyrosine autokinase [Allosphingosinicella sp.]|nr:polysaccharide biosynthesis tyrosine autokinase [Allosphingosinicella sp.]